MRRVFRLKYISQSGKWPSGNPRLYVRRPGQKLIALPDAPQDSPVFLAAYAEICADIKTPRIAQKGTIARAISDFQGSDDFQRRAASTRQMWSRAYRDFADKYGPARIADLQPKHIRKDLASLSAHPANNRLKAWRSLCQWCEERGLIETNPAHMVKARKTAKTTGHTPWTRADIETFRNHWPHDTPQRLAFELMHWTTAAIGDATRLTRAMIDASGWLDYQRQKTGTGASCPFYAPVPAWAESPEHLHRAIEAQPVKHVSFMVTAHGKPRSAKAAASWFSQACTDAGLPHLSAHGIRKHRAAVFKENGAPTDKRMAWMGHESESEATEYSRAADRKKTIMGTEIANPTAKILKLS